MRPRLDVVDAIDEGDSACVIVMTSSFRPSSARAPSMRLRPIDTSRVDGAVDEYSDVQDTTRSVSARVRAHPSTPVVVLVIAACVALVIRGHVAGRERRIAFDGFFSRLDGDGDGELSVRELSKFFRTSVGGEELDQSHEVLAAARGTLARMDFEGGETVSLEELGAHASGRLLSAHEVGEWIEHGVRLPEYSALFMERGITMLDFPSMVANEGEALRASVGVPKAAHREALTRAMKKQLLGFGRAPSAPRSVSAYYLQGIDHLSVGVSWKEPKHKGKPTLHEYVVQSGVGVGGRVFKWTDVEVVDANTLAIVIKRFKQSPGMSYKFRVIAWGEYGCSDAGAAESKWLSGDVKDEGGWVSTLITFGLMFRFIVSFRRIPRRIVLCMIGFLRYVRARAKGQDVTVSEFVPSFFEPPSPMLANGNSDGAGLFTPTKVLEKRESMSDDIYSPAYVPMEELKRQASEHLREAEFYCGAGGSDGFCREDPVLRARHSREASLTRMDSSSALDFRRDLSRVLSNSRCNEPGCKVSWRGKGARRIGPKVHKHFCGLCQAWYCETHTRVSPHGNRGCCQPESRCVCSYDYNMLTKDEQAVLDMDNKYSLETRMQHENRASLPSLVFRKLARRKRFKRGAALVDAFESRAQTRLGSQ